MEIKSMLDSMGVLTPLRIAKEAVRPKFVEKTVNYQSIQFRALVRGGDIIESIDRYGVYEPSFVDKLIELSHAGQFVVDVGCAEGMFSLAAAALTQTPERILAADADELFVRMLKKNFKMNRLAPPRVETCYVSDVSSSRTKTLDELVARAQFERIDLVKIDVEGYEVRVLRGAETVLRDHRPHLMLEIHPAKVEALGGSMDALAALLAAHGGPVIYCENHRGPHRGADTPWVEASLDDLARVWDKMKACGQDNFAVCVLKNSF